MLDHTYRLSGITDGCAHAREDSSVRRQTRLSGAVGQGGRVSHDNYISVLKYPLMFVFLLFRARCGAWAKQGSRDQASALVGKAVLGSLMADR
jgi:hypothetical protein